MSFTFSFRSFVAAACATAAAGALAPQCARAEATFVTRSLVAELANKAAMAALEACRKEGFQVGVAVTDRSGVLQAFVRDRFAGAHTVEVATDKAWTAASFRMPTAMLGDETQAGKPMSGIRGASRVMPIGGGLPIEASGSTIAAIGVSGAPGGEADERCAQKGIDAIRMDVEMQ
ncbi:MAG: heme-binding protein [Burkholderiaceae bacterium]|nr:heme-binding protein [Burkholderiaceae bacterium]